MQNLGGRKSVVVFPLSADEVGIIYMMANVLNFSPSSLQLKVGSFPPSLSSTAVSLSTAPNCLIFSARKRGKGEGMFFEPFLPSFLEKHLAIGGEGGLEAMKTFFAEERKEVFLPRTRDFPHLLLAGRKRRKRKLKII